MLDPSFWKRCRVLLTGHTGFKGSWLLLWLQELGAQVWAYALEPEPEPNLYCQLAQARPGGDAWQLQNGDLADLEALKALVQRSQLEVVLHLAAQPLVRRSYEDPLGTWATNYPRSPYGVAKLYAYWITVNCCEAYVIYACNSILFNNQSPRRGESFVTRKVTGGLASINKILWGASQYDGTPKKRLNVDKLAEMGWEARIPLAEGLVNTVAEFHEQLARKLVRQ